FSLGQHASEHLATHVRELMFSVFGVVYLVFLPAYFPAIRQLDDGLNWLILFFLVNWMGDVAAFFGGKKLGKRKLYAAVSPKKTVAGAVFAIIASEIVAVIYHLIHPFSAGLVPVMAIVGGVSLFAQIGDLCESLIKRAYGKKDS